MAEYQTATRQTHAVGADIDAGLRAYMNKVYSLMSVAMADHRRCGLFLRQ